MIILTNPSRLIKTTMFLFLVWGFTLLIFGEEVAKVTSYAFIVEKLSYFDARIVGLFLILNTVLLAWAYKLKRNFYTVVFLTIQQLFLGLGIFGVGFAVWQGMYLDGTVVSRFHIFADQFLYLILVCIHLQEYYRFILTFFYYENFYEANKQKSISN